MLVVMDFAGFQIVLLDFDEQLLSSSLPCAVMVISRVCGLPSRVGLM